MDIKESYGSRLGNWRHSLVGQLLLRVIVCLMFFFLMIGSIQYLSLRQTLYQSVEQNLINDYNSIRNNTAEWFISSTGSQPQRFADLRPGNFVALYSTARELKGIYYGYGKYEEDVEIFANSLNLNLREAAQASRPFLVTDEFGSEYMMMVKRVSLDKATLTSILGRYDIEALDRLLSYLDFRERSEWPYSAPFLGYVVLGEPLAQEKQILSDNLQAYIFNAALILLLSVLISSLALQKPLQPLTDIAETARRIARGHHDLRIPEQRAAATEVFQLSKALNHMLEQMENALNTERQAKDQMSRFIGDASHELRTPLTSIRGFLEILTRSNCTDKPTLDEAHRAMLAETERLIRLTENLLTLNRLAQQEESALPAQSTLRDVLAETLPLFHSLLEEKALLLNGEPLEKPGDDSALRILLPLQADELKQVLYNLLSNAIQHTERGGIIELELREDEERLVLIVKDNGRGVPKKDIPYLFDRFFRGDRSRSRKDGQGGGAGLGLSIVAEIVKLRRGKIHVESELGKGSAFYITFPKQ